MNDQTSIFDFITDPNKQELYKITKPIRLIELFGGIGSQAMALRNIGADFESWKLVEFDKFPIASYNAIHGTDYKPMDIREVHAEDLEIVDTDDFCYIVTYSFPCTDLSVAGQMLGMKKGSGTRSGLLWEVERLIDECDVLTRRGDGHGMPQILLMENVPQVHGKRNIDDFNDWLRFLERRGYSNFWKDMNAKNYGVAQNRNRTFCVSILGNYGYEFPEEIPLTRVMKDYLEEEVDEKYYIKSERAEKLIDQLVADGKLPQNDSGGGYTDKPFDTESLTRSPLPTAYRQEPTEEYRQEGRKETVWLNYSVADRVQCSKDDNGP